MKILILHGPNLNLLGQREPETYGTVTLEQINASLKAQADTYKLELQTHQSNHEGELIEQIHHARTGNIDFIIINPAAYTHTSIAIRDALAAVKIPFIEVHLSNIYRRENFRHHSYFSDLALAVVSGMGSFGYNAALEYASQYLQSNKNKR